MRLRESVVSVLVVLAVLVVGSGCDRAPVAAPAPSATSSTVPPPPAASAPATHPHDGQHAVKSRPTCAKTGFDCGMQARFAAVQRYLRERPGTVGIVVRDRHTGAVWRNEHAGDMTWTASTIKLGMAVDLLLRNRSGEITLTDGDRGLMRAMLHSSDDDAADRLWDKYSGPDHRTFNAHFARYGMPSVAPQPGFSDVFPYWGFQKCTANDLDGLINYVLQRLPSQLREYLVGQLGTVAPDQQWGVWGAGQRNHPGNKNGWSKEQGGWVVNSVGFAGPNERYTVSLMNNLRDEGGFAEGRETDTHIAALLFGG